MFLRQHLLTAVLAASVLGVAPASWAASDSQSFLKSAIEGNLAEIAVGKLAHTKGTNDAVRNFGQLLVDDHTKANQDATEAAKGMGLKLPTAPNPEQQELYQRLAKEPGHTFDTDFVNAMLQDHQKDIEEYQAASGQKDAAGSYATKTLPALQKHLEAVQKVAKEMGI